ncbi:hypothetical protein [Microbacterium sp. 2FI]|uniref:TetR/AcrR family transcriptional regulator n=1 Tax=Microbacterium sp. 2FI TaxID=2502193 RepID=UPI0010F5E28E|nr:hypothetical protein [Microbacterium sp. 2FI]
MTASAAKAVPASRRTRGERAGIDRARIVEAARGFDPDTLTMKAVADELGVDRKTLNHHVSDRDTLLGLMALDAFSDTFSAVQVAAQGTWQDACRTFARGFTDSVISTGVLVEHLRVEESLATVALEATEAVIEKMIEAGFDDESAVRCLALLTNICMAFARDIVSISPNQESSRLQLLRRALEGRSRADFVNLSRIADSRVNTYTERQLDLSIDVFLNGAGVTFLDR